MKNTVLLLTSILLAVLLFPIGFLVAIFYKDFDKYLLTIAEGIDQLGNVVCSRLFNLLLIKKGGYQFGFVEETISSVIGKNQLTNTLTGLGKLLNAFFNVFEKKHSFKSIEIFPQNK